MRLLTFILVMGLLVLSAQGQNGSKRPQDQLVRKGTVLANSELTNLTRAKDGTVFVTGYTLEKGIWSHPIIWKLTGGTVWKELPANPIYVQWLSDKTGWISAPGEGIYKTIDGGDSWTRQIPPEKQYGEPFFLDEWQGWYFDYDENQLVHFSGGSVNKLVAFPAGSVNRKLQFVSSDRGWVRDVLDGRSRIQKTLDGGKTWKLVKSPSSEVDFFQFLDEEIGFVVTPAGVYSTSDGGSHWTLVLSVGKEDWIDRLFFMSPNIGWTFGKRLCRTVTAGRNWQCEVNPPVLKGNTVKGLTFTDRDNGWLLIDNSLFRTTDGGRTWQRQTLTAGGIVF